MKALYLIIPATLMIAACTAPVVVSTPAPPAVVAAVPAPLTDMDGDGVADIHDRFPYDWRYR